MLLLFGSAFFVPSTNFINNVQKNIFWHLWIESRLKSVSCFESMNSQSATIVMHTVFSPLFACLITSEVTTCLTSFSRVQTGPQSDKDMSIGWSGSPTFLRKALRCTLTTKRETVWVDVRLVPVQCRGGLAETHVCSLLTLLCFLVRGSTLSLGLFYHHPHHLSFFSFSPHNGALCCALIRSSSYWEAGSDQTECSSCSHPPQ